jgi:hypothetical protein
MNLFYAEITITIGNHNVAPFWHSPWLNGMKPKDIAPLIFEVSTRKKWSVSQALHNNAWISKIKVDASLSIQHIHMYIQLWELLSNVSLVVEIDNSIVWH